MRRSICTVILLVVLASACKKEYSYEGGNGISRKCVGCEYLPLCDSSVFVYVDSSNTIDTLTGIVRVGTDSSIDGKTYSHVTGFAAFPTGSCIIATGEIIKPSWISPPLESILIQLCRRCCRQFNFPFPYHREPYRFLKSSRLLS
jgi:hypothetical protein